MRGRQKSSFGVMTEQDRQTCWTILGIMASKGIIPTLQEIGDELTITRQAVDIRLKSMAERGLIEKRPYGVSRWFALSDIGASELEAYASKAAPVEALQIKEKLDGAAQPVPTAQIITFAEVRSHRAKKG